VKKRPKPVHKMNEAQFEAMFPNGDDDAPKAYLKARRWPQGVRCPRCGNPAVYDLPSRRWHWQCEKCAPDGYRFSVIAGTIFENTNKPLRQWFKVVHLMTTSKKGISSLQIQRQMGFGSYETALNMTHKIRAAMIEPEQKLGGIVEVDETYIGGKDSNRHWDKRSGKRGPASGKTPVIGAVQRKGNVIARVLKSVDAHSVLSFIYEAVSNKVSLLATDSWPGYTELSKDYPHGSVDHHRNQYVVGAVHTNTIEGFWSIFKRGVVGTFHKVSAKYLPLYVAEFQFRYNNRDRVALDSEDVVYRIERTGGRSGLYLFYSDAYEFGLAEYFGRPTLIRRGSIILLKPETKLTGDVIDRSKEDGILVGKFRTLMGALNWNDVYKYEPR
jgi:transposase-like protein